MHIVGELIMIEWVVWSIQPELASDGKVVLFDDKMPCSIRAWPPPRASAPTACLFTLLCYLRLQYQDTHLCLSW